MRSGNLRIVCGILQGVDVHSTWRSALLATTASYRCSEDDVVDERVCLCGEHVESALISGSNALLRQSHHQPPVPLTMALQHQRGGGGLFLVASNPKSWAIFIFRGIFLVTSNTMSWKIVIWWWGGGVFLTTLDPNFSSPPRKVTVWEGGVFLVYQV